jgi:hypothetical protein
MGRNPYRRSGGMKVRDMKLWDTERVIAEIKKLRMEDGDRGC